MQGGRLRPAVLDGDANEYVLRRGLGVLHEDVEVAVFREDAGIEQFVLRLQLRAGAVGLDQIVIGVGQLRVLVEPLHVGVGGRRVQVVVVLLDVFAVVALGAGQAEEPLLDDRVLTVPEGQSKTKQLVLIGEAGQPIFARTVGAGAGLIVGEVVPRVPVGAVVLAYRAPLALAQVGSPLLPRCPGPGFSESFLLGVHVRRCHLDPLRNL